MGEFSDYIANLTAIDLDVEGDGNCILKFAVEGYGVEGDAEGNVEFLFECEGTGDQVPWAEIEFKILEILAQDTNSADIIFPITVEAIGQFNVVGNASFPLLQCNSSGRQGNTADIRFKIEVSGEAEARNEYELCQSI